MIATLVEGASINATCRLTGVAKYTVLKLLKDMGSACAAYHNTASEVPTQVALNFKLHY